MEIYRATHAASLATQREYQKNNREVYRAACAKWRKENPEKQKAATARWARENAHMSAASHARYYARKKQRSPKWLTSEQRQEILVFYAWARAKTHITGIPHVVDHIVPMHGETVCGLHVPWNLQVLTASENIRKGNQWPYPLTNPSEPT